MTDIPMTPESAMNQILYSACPANLSPDGIRLFYIETHCVAWEIEAKLKSDDHNGPNYEIISMKRHSEE